MKTNLPSTPQTSNQEVKNFFDKFFTHKVSFPAGQIDAVVSFFLKRNFDLTSAKSTTIVLLNQARIDNIDVFKLIDSLKTLTDVQLSQMVTQVLNAYREKTSLLGYKINQISEPYENRNILI